MARNDLLASPNLFPNPLNYFNRYSNRIMDLDDRIERRSIESHAWKRKAVAVKKKRRRSAREGRKRRGWKEGKAAVDKGRENKIKEGNHWQFFTSFLKRGLGTRGESLNRFFRRAPFLSRLLARRPTRAPPLLPAVSPAERECHL